MPTNFFDLPAEIRNQIYYEALVPARGVRPTEHVPNATRAQNLPRALPVHTRYLPGSFPAADLASHLIGGPTPSLLLAHPQIFREANAMHWRQNSFVFELEFNDIIAGLPAVTAWFNSLTPQTMRQVGNITLFFEDRFTIEFGHTMINGRPTLELQHLHQATDRDWEEDQIRDPISQQYVRVALIPYDDRLVIASVNEALDLALNHSETDLAIPPGWNLLGGIAQFLLALDVTINWEICPKWYTAKQFVMGEAFIMPARRFRGLIRDTPYPHNPKSPYPWR